MQHVSIVCCFLQGNASNKLLGVNVLKYKHDRAAVMLYIKRGRHKCGIQRENTHPAVSERYRLMAVKVFY